MSWSKTDRNRSRSGCVKTNARSNAVCAMTFAATFSTPLSSPVRELPACSSFMPALFRDGCVGAPIVKRKRAGAHVSPQAKAEQGA